MPTYQYKCEECGIVFERFQHFSDAPIETCPECSGPVHRVIQPVGIIFKGKGFYVTDNKSDTSSLMPKPESSDKQDEPEGKAAKSKSETTEKEAKPEPAVSKKPSEPEQRQSTKGA